jgi:hypothetical protein
MSSSEKFKHVAELWNKKKEEENPEEKKPKGKTPRTAMGKKKE